MSSKSDACSSKKSGTVERECSTRKLKKALKGSSADSIGGTESTEFVLFNHSFNSPNFSKRSLISAYSRATSASESSRKGKSSSESLMKDEPISIRSGGSESTKMSTVSRYFKNLSQSRGSMGTLSLKKTDETTNFSFEKCEPDSCIIECAVERLQLENNGGTAIDIPRSDIFLSDSILNAIDVDSQGGDYVRCEKKSQSSVPFQRSENTIKGSSALVIKPKKGRTPRNYWSKSFFLKKSQILSYFATDEKNKPLSEPDIENKEPSSEKIVEKKKIRRKDMEVRYLDPPVPVEEDLEIKQSLREMFFYIAELVCITLISLSLVTSSMYYFNSSTAKLFFETPFRVAIFQSSLSQGTPLDANFVTKTLKEANTIVDFWAFSEEVLLDVLYWDSYNFEGRGNSSSKKDWKMIRENKLLGVARMRQVRVTENSCEIHKDMSKFFEVCHGVYSVFSADTKPIKEDMENSSTATAWVYTEAKDLDSSYYWGHISVYGGGGYYLDFGPNKSETAKMIAELKEYDWVSSATRAIFISFNLYNVNINLFCICRIVLEFPPVGGIISVDDFHSIKMIRYVNTYDFLVLGFEFVYTLFVVYNSILELKTFNRERVSYVFFWWNILNFSKLLLSYLYILLSIVRKIYSKQLMDEIQPNLNNHIDFQFIKRIHIAYTDIVALLVFLSWVKLFVFFSLTKTMLQFRKTLSRSLNSMIVFLPMFVTTFFGFAFLGYLLFGNQVWYYRTLWASFLTLFQAFLGQFSYIPLVEAHRILGPIFFVAFIFFIFFVLLNVFIAITNDAYLTVRSQIIPESPKHLKYLKKALVNLFTCWRPMKKRKSRKITRQRILFNDIKAALRRSGFRDEEISIFFQKYDINCRNFLQDKTKTRILKDLELSSLTFTETSEQFQIDSLRRRLDDFRERMENWEVRLQPVIDKVDILLHRM